MIRNYNVFIYTDYPIKHNNVFKVIFFYYIFNRGVDVQDIKSIFNFIDKTEIPKLPVSGELLGKYGFEKGEKMGRVLKQIEQDWINNDFDLKENFINKYLDFKN